MTEDLPPSVPSSGLEAWKRRAGPNSCCLHIFPNSGARPLLCGRTVDTRTAQQQTRVTVFETQRATSTVRLRLPSSLKLWLSAGGAMIRIVICTLQLAPPVKRLHCKPASE